MARKKKRKYSLGSSEDPPSAELVEAHRELHLLRVEGFLHDSRRSRGKGRVKTATDESGLVDWAKGRAEKLDSLRRTT